MPSRREFLGALGLPAVSLWSGLDPLRLAESRAAARELAQHPGTPAEIAEDEGYWAEVARAFAVDRSVVNLNNGGVHPPSSAGLTALARYAALSNELPPHNMWSVLEPRREDVRAELAREYGCDAEELAFVRNASEGLEICQLGLDLARGDEILTTNQDYPRMLATFRQRERREGLKLVLISLPVPCEDPSEIVARFERAITPRTKLILACHMINLTGQILPVRELVAMARRHGLPLIVDGAHALAHFVFTLAELDCDYYAASLHKWMAAPIGTGLLYVRRAKIAGLWPLMGAPVELDGDIRKFEEIGTHPVGYRLAIGEALAFHRDVGPERKAARLVHLRDRWARRLLAASDRVRLHTSLKPGFACGIANFEVTGLPSGELQAWLWREHRILTTPILHAEFEGLRVSPSVYTRPADLDRFCDAVEHALVQGLR